MSRSQQLANMFGSGQFPVQSVPKAGTLTDAATINWNCDNGQLMTITLGGNRTMAAPTNVKQNATYMLRVIQDATGSRTITWDSVFKFGTSGAPILSTGANKVDWLNFIGGAGGTLEYLGGRFEVI